MKKLIQQLNKPLSRYVWQPLYAWYSSSARYTTLKGMKLLVLQGVFHPSLFFSTKILLNWLEKYELQDIRLLEIGSGSGAVSIYASKKGAVVTAVDINPTACECTKLNAKNNQQIIEVYESDLLVSVPLQCYDVIMINPPYYPKTPTNYTEHAWYCGEGFTFFKKLFEQVGAYMSPNAKIVLVLSEHCEIFQIKELAHARQLSWKEIERFENIVEKNYLFEINKV